MFNQSFLVLRFTITSAIFCLMLGSFAPTKINAASSYVYDEECLDHYRMHILGAYSFFHAPDASQDAYLISTTIELDNGLTLFIVSEEYQHIESAIDEFENMSYLYSYKGKGRPGTEVFLEALPSNMIDGELEFILKPTYDRVIISNWLNESFLEILPNIVGIDRRSSEIELSDGSFWNCTSKVIDDWEINARILVSITEKGPNLINVDEISDKLVEVQFLGMAVKQ